MFERRRMLGWAGATMGVLAGPRALRAQAPWPNRPIRLIVAFAAGGAADSVARVLAPRLGDRLGQTVVVENRTGGSGSNGGALVAQAAPDGHTLLWDASSHLVNPSLLKGLSFDYATAFLPVTLATTFPQVLAVKADSPIRSVAEFIAAAKARPGTLNMGTQGNATAGHLALAQLQRLAGIEVTHAPYRGGADAARDLAAGVLDGAFITVLSAGPIADSGRARLLAVATESRIAARPDVPTFAEAGLPGLTIAEWCALFAPAGTPMGIAERLHAATASALADPEVKARLDGLVAVPVGSSPADFARFVVQGRAEMGTLVREAGIRAE
ncbi:Bug family tripartite tricarboxylate transporter substrate binding protein [Pararoseomonas indoligenes]|uniref:Twin-arginine translocation pathway signal protein n=1 Tax=Roseomonas indoligenes TaxID=2820811 RepID=A0A940S6V1_9PROT|nr:tripartite tricarboxylate transporter substrate-binding protein [Pararoseomonas indoligenes]MBP0494399.1 twin-arginine translocation pathway signal protein [Pararoseomonas indoligenes]